MKPNAVPIACRVLVAISLIFVLSRPARASFQLQPESVRSAAMGGASLGSSGESVALFTNPAGLARLESVEASFQYSKLYANLPGVNLGLGSMAFGMPTRVGSFGVGIGNFTASGLKEERTLALSFGTDILGDRLQLGVTGKQFFHSYKPGTGQRASRDPIFKNGLSRSAIGLDIGMSAHIAGPLTLGLTVRNANQPDVGLASEDRVKREFQIGAVFDIQGMGLKAFGDVFYKDLGFSTESGPLLPALGIEKALLSENFAFRLGANPLEFSGGFGMRMRRVGIDYALVINRGLLQDNAGTHRLALSFQFGSRGERIDVFEMETLYRD